MRIYWSFENDAAQAAGALPPEKKARSNSSAPENSPFRAGNSTAKWRAIENGYRVVPDDCGPVRNLDRFGFFVRCPGRVIARRLLEPTKYREIDSTVSRYGLAELSGGEWPDSDSGFVASWIAGSEFFKIQTGIRIYFPIDSFLYQGPIPNESSNSLEVMAGLEYAVPKRTVMIGGASFATCDLNVIARLPEYGREVRTSTGQPIAWFYPIPKDTAKLSELDIIDEMAENPQFELS